MTLEHFAETGNDVYVVVDKAFDHRAKDMGSVSVAKVNPGQELSYSYMSGSEYREFVRRWWELGDQY